jgi:hypothetical protein
MTFSARTYARFPTDQRERPKATTGLTTACALFLYFSFCRLALRTGLG